MMNARGVLKEWSSGGVWVGLGYGGIIDSGEWIGQCGLGNMDCGGESIEVLHEELRDGGGKREKRG